MDIEEVQAGLKGLIKEKRSLAHVTDQLFRGVLSAKTWGDTSLTNVVYYRELWDLFPQARYIVLIRDGRDVVASFKAGGKASFGELSDIKVGCDRWLVTMEALTWLKKRTRVLEVRYEDLVVATQATLDRICEHLNVPSFQDWEQYISKVPETRFYEPDHHQAIRKLPFDNSIGRWKSRLTEEEADYCQGRIGKHLKLLGYN